VSVAVNDSKVTVADDATLKAGARHSEPLATSPSAPTAPSRSKNHRRQGHALFASGFLRHDRRHEFR
jgi:hypothetical protein